MHLSINGVAWKGQGGGGSWADLLGKKSLQLIVGAEGPVAGMALVVFHRDFLVVLQVQRQSFHPLQLGRTV